MKVDLKVFRKIMIRSLLSDEDFESMFSPVKRVLLFWILEISYVRDPISISSAYP